MPTSGKEPPSPDSYGRVTDAARFEGLHRIALERLEELESRFRVRRIEPCDLDHLPPIELSRAAVRLEPTDASAAPIAVAFTTFPGLIVRAGQWTTELFPVCGCDACGKTLDDESRRFLELIDNVVAGRFRESITVPWLGSAAQTKEHWSRHGSYAAGWSSIERKRARELVADGPGSRDWKPWQERGGGMIERSNDRTIERSNEFRIPNCELRLLIDDRGNPQSPIPNPQSPIPNR